MRRRGVVTQSLKTTPLMCMLTGDIAKLAILKHARIALQKNIFNERLQHVHKISTHHKEQGFPTGDACTPWGCLSAYRFLSCIKSAFIFGFSVSIFQRCYALVIRNSQTSKWCKTLSLFVVGYNQILKTKCVLAKE